MIHARPLPQQRLHRRLMAFLARQHQRRPRHSWPALPCFPPPLPPSTSTTTFPLAIISAVNSRSFRLQQVSLLLVILVPRRLLRADHACCLYHHVGL